MLLAIETATPACSVALVDGDELIDERHDIVGRGHAEKLIPMVEALLGRRRPQAIVVDCGPGSFTGVRVGLAAAHGLAFGWGIAVSGYSSMTLLATNGRAPHVAVALHGGHGELFVQSFDGGSLAALDTLRSLTPDAAAKAISAHHVVGDGASILVEHRGYGEPIDALPRAADLRFLPEALRNLEVRPIYGRAPDAKPMA